MLLCKGPREGSVFLRPFAIFLIGTGSGDVQHAYICTSRSYGEESSDSGYSQGCRIVE